MSSYGVSVAWAINGGQSVRFVGQRGKGSHGTLYYGSERTILQDLKKELPTGTVHTMLNQLGLKMSDLLGER